MAQSGEQPHPRRGGTCHGELFFMYDRTAMHGEEGLLEEAVLYYYPKEEFTGGKEDSVETQHRIMQMMGSSQALVDISGEMPTLVTLRKEQIALRHWDTYTLAMSAPLSESSSRLQHLLDRLFDVFAFFHGSFKRVHLQAGEDLVKFCPLLAAVWSCYLPFVRRFGSTTASLFHPLAYVQLPKREGHLFLQASHILQSGQRLPAVLGGAILFQSQILCTQLEPVLTQHCLSLMFSPKNAEDDSPVDHPGIPLPTAIGNKIPSSVRILSVYVTPEQYARLYRTSPFGSMLSSSSCGGGGAAPDRQDTVTSSTSSFAPSPCFSSNWESTRSLTPPSPLGSRSPSPWTSSGQLLRSVSTTGGNRSRHLANWISEGRGAGTPRDSSPASTPVGYRTPNSHLPQLPAGAPGRPIPESMLRERFESPVSGDNSPSKPSLMAVPLYPPVDFATLGWRPRGPPSMATVDVDAASGILSIGSDASTVCLDRPSGSEPSGSEILTPTGSCGSALSGDFRQPDASVSGGRASGIVSVASGSSALISADAAAASAGGDCSVLEDSDADADDEVTGLTSSAGKHAGHSAPGQVSGHTDKCDVGPPLGRTKLPPDSLNCTVPPPGGQENIQTRSAVAHNKPPSSGTGADLARNRPRSNPSVPLAQIGSETRKTLSIDLPPGAAHARAISPHIGFRPSAIVEREQRVARAGSPFSPPNNPASPQNGRASPATTSSSHFSTRHNSSSSNISAAAPLAARVAAELATTDWSRGVRSGPDVDEVEGLKRLNLYVQSHSATTMVLIAESGLQDDDVTIMSLFKHSLSQLGDLEVNLKHVLNDDFTLSSEEFSSLAWDSFNATLTSVNLPTCTERSSRTEVTESMHRSADAMHDIFAVSPTVSDVTLKSNQGSVFGRRTFGRETFFQQRPRPGAMSWQGIEPTTKAFTLEQTGHDELKRHGVLLL